MRNEKEYQLRRVIARLKKRTNSKYTNVEAVKRSVNRGINGYKAVTGRHPKPFDLYRLALILDYVYENSQRENVRALRSDRSREEWAELEAEYIGNPPPIDTDSKFCAAWDCFNKLPKKSRRKYCPGDRCANEQKAAKKRLKDHGTLLPVKAYAPKRAETVDKAYKEAERALDPSKLDYVGRVMPKARPTQDSNARMHRIRNVRLRDDAGGETIFRVSIADGSKKVENPGKYRRYFGETE